MTDIGIPASQMSNLAEIQNRLRNSLDFAAARRRSGDRMAADPRFIHVIPTYLADSTGVSYPPLPAIWSAMSWFIGTDYDDSIYGDGIQLVTAAISDDLIQGGRGEDLLVGDYHTLDGTLRGGNDILNGGLNNDRLYGDANYLLEQSRGGDDILYGEEGLDVIYGDAQWMFDDAVGGNDDIRGGDGNDLLLAGDAQGMYGNAIGGDDRLDGGAGDDEIVGDADTGLDAARGGNDVIFAGPGNDVLVGDFAAYGNGYHGVGGSDRFIFGVGSGEDLIKDFEVGKDIIQIKPSYGFWNFADLATRIHDDANGNAVIILRKSWTSVPPDIITLRGVSSSELSAADFLFSDETVTGSAGSNQINPTTSVLAYRTTGIADVIFGMDGNDVIDGGGGADVMNGGNGNDTFIVATYSDDGIATNDDQVVEAVGGGVDTVNALVSYRLAANVENLTQTGAGASDGWGNELNNVITGNAYVNMLSGGLGSDVLYGRDGDDNLLGGGGDDQLFGDKGNDELLGEAGNDILRGGSGKDSMTGGLGSDRFVFVAIEATGNGSGSDRILDFQSGQDSIDLDIVIAGSGPAFYAEARSSGGSYSDALATAESMIGGGTSVVFIAGQIDGWLFWSGSGVAGRVDQVVTLAGANSLDFVWSGDII